MGKKNYKLQLLFIYFLILIKKTAAKETKLIPWSRKN